MTIAPRKERNSENYLLRDCRQEDREANNRIFCRITTRQGLDLVEGSTPAKRKKKTSNKGGTGNVEAPASPERVNVRWMRATSECETTGSSGKLTGNRSKRAGLKKGADVAVRERKTGRKNAEQDKK
jgi:hypothetical protein